METKIYNQLPDEAKEVRLEVFVKEQGFEEEFDDIDKTAAHIVLFDGSHPVGVCRVFTDPVSGRVMIGRVAVRKAFRGRGLGADIIKAAEEYAAKTGSIKYGYIRRSRQPDFIQRSATRTPEITMLKRAVRIY